MTRTHGHVTTEEEAREVDGVRVGGDKVVQDRVDGSCDVARDTCRSPEVSAPRKRSQMKRGAPGTVMTSSTPRGCREG